MEIRGVQSEEASENDGRRREYQIDTPLAMSSSRKRHDSFKITKIEDLPMWNHQRGVVWLILIRVRDKISLWRSFGRPERWLSSWLHFISTYVWLVPKPLELWFKTTNQWQFYLNAELHQDVIVKVVVTQILHSPVIAFEPVFPQGSLNGTHLRGGICVVILREFPLIVRW